MQVEFEIDNDELVDAVVNSRVFNDAISDAVDEIIDYTELSKNVFDEIKGDLSQIIIDDDDILQHFIDNITKHDFIVDIMSSINELRDKNRELLRKLTNIELAVERQKNSVGVWQKFKDWFLKG